MKKKSCFILLAAVIMILSAIPVSAKTSIAPGVVIDQAKGSAYIMDSVLKFGFVLWFGANEFFQRFHIGETHYLSAFARQQFRLIIAAACFVLFVHGNAGHQIKAFILERFQNSLNDLRCQRLGIIGTVVEFQTAHCTRVGSVIGKCGRAGVTAAGITLVAHVRKTTFAFAAGDIVLLNDSVAVRTTHGT